MKIVTIILAFLFSYNVFGQIFIEQIRIGEKMPTEINVGEFTEEESENCNCRTFAIEYGYDLNDPWTVQSLKSQKDAKLGSVISLHYDSENIIVGILKIDMNFDENKTSELFKNDFEYDMKLIEQFNDFEFLEKKLTGGNKFYSIKIKNYENSNIAVLRTKGIVRNMRIEETYKPNSSYLPKYELTNRNIERSVSEPIEIAESFGDLDKDGIDEKVVVLDTGIEIKSGTKRQILIYKKSNDNWELWHKSEGAVISGGLMNSSFETINIERGCIVIKHFGGMRSKWFYTHRFRYQNSDWELIGATIDYYTLCELSEKFDFNFSTGKMIYQSEIENCAKGENSKLANKETKEFRKKLNTLPKMDGFKVGENTIEFSESNRQFYF